MPSFDQFLDSFNYNGSPLGGGAGPTNLTSKFGSYQDLFGTVLSGSREAATQLREGLQRSFEARREGIAGSFQGYERDILNQAQSSGLNETVARRILAEQEQAPRAAISQARAETEGQLGMGLSELAKGTGTELAGLGFQVKGLEQQRYLAEQMLKEMRKARRAGIFGDIFGGVANIAANAFLPGSGFALQAAMSGGGGGGGPSFMDFGDLGVGDWPGFASGGINVGSPSYGPGFTGPTAQGWTY